MYLAEFAQSRLPRQTLDSIWQMPWESQASALRRAIFESLAIEQQHAVIGKFNAQVSPHSEFCLGVERVIYAKRLKYINNEPEFFDTEEEALSDALESLEADFAVALTFVLRETLGGAK